MGINYEQAVGLEGFEDIADFQLDEQEQKGIAALTGIVVFPPNLAAPGGAPGFDAKFGVDIMVQKGSEDAQLLFAVSKHVATTKWGEDTEREYDIALQIASGLKKVNVNIKDGDLIDPEFNAGFWVVGAKNEDQPVILDAQGRVCTRPDQYPTRNWAVRCIIEFWAQPKRDRVNTRLLAVQGLFPAARRVGRTQEQTLALVQGVVAKLPAISAPQAAVRQAIAAPAPEARPAPAAPAAAPSRRRAAPVEAEAPAPAPKRGRGAAKPPQEDPSAFFREAAPAEAEPAPRRGRRVVVEDSNGDEFDLEADA